MKSLEIDFSNAEYITVIDQLVDNSFKILSVKYDSEMMGFQVECIPPSSKVPVILPFNRECFPNHTPVPFLDEQVQIGEVVHVWFKEEEILKNEGWKETSKNTLVNSKSIFKIGKGKKPYLGGAHKATVCLDSKFRPLLVIDNYRFTADMVKCVIKSELLLYGKTVTLETSNGSYSYDANAKRIIAPNGNILNSGQVDNIIDLLRKAEMI